MAEQTGIQWTDHTYNPWVGCRKVSAGCKHCFMFRDMTRFGQDPHAVRRTSPRTFNAPLRWKAGRVFTCSWSDFFIEDADAWRPDAWDVIRRTPHLTYQILTKRPERIRECLPPDWGAGWPHVWLGVSIEAQEQAHRALTLAGIPARVRFVSAEPLLGPVNLAAVVAMHTGVTWNVLAGTGSNDASCPPIHWVIVGGESGSPDTSRVCDAAWVRGVVAQCQREGVPVFVKQLGAKYRDEPHNVAGRFLLAPVDGPRRLVDDAGGDTAEWPPGLLIREYPA